MEVGKRDGGREGERIRDCDRKNRDREIEKQRETRRQGDTEESYRTTKEKILLCFPVWALF